MIFMKTLIFILLPVFFISCSENGKQVVTTKENTIVKTSDSVIIRHDIYGSGDTTLLFLHGWGINRTYWDNQVKFFSPNYKVVTVDQAGFGESDTTRQDYQFERYSKDVSELIAQLELKNVVLIGHSMSGDIILETAIAYPQNIVGLVGIDNFIGVGKPFTAEEKKEVDDYVSKMEADYKASVRAYAESSLFHKSTDTLIKERVKNDITSGSERVSMSTFKNIIVYGQKESEKLPQLKLRLNLLNSDANHTDTAALAKYTGASYKVYPIPATGHYPMIEKPDAFNEILAGILNDISHPKQ
jgi:pimeloyl-ACP methyl ester carboxylesterase